MKDDILHAPLPKGPAGQFSCHVPFADMVMGYSKNQKAAKDFLRWFHTKKIYEQWFTSQQGFSVGPTKMWENHPVWNVDPVMAAVPHRGGKRPLRRLCRAADRKAAEVHHQVHHRRHVRQGDPGHAGRRRGEMRRMTSW